MIFGGAFGLIFIGFISILFIICCFLIYLKWFHKINIKYSSIGLGGIENFDINHNLFHLHIKYINFLSSFSIFILRLPIISIDNIHLKINSIKNKIINKKKQKKDWHKKLYFLKYVSIRIEQLQIQYENINIFFHHITLHPSATPNTTNSDTWINCEYIELSIIDKIEQFSSNNSSFVLLKSTWHSVEIQTNFDQNLLINSTHWSIELDYKLFDYLKQKQTHSTVQQYQRETSNFLYEDPNLLSITQTTHSNNLLIKFDQWVEFFYDPFINICIRQIDLQYRSIDNTLHYHTFDKVDFSFHNSSNGSFQTQHAYIANIRLHSHSTLLLHGLCQITIFPTRLDIACQFNELNIELCEDTIQQFHTLLSSRSSTSSNNTWKCDRQIDISFQFLNPFMRLKMNDINELFIWQINFFKLSFHSNENSETK
ncbi:unnamed protein product [Rotaria sp. Silwood1]|nr:unnamed protein product [Rotaria sp. Silwood1]